MAALEESPEEKTIRLKFQYLVKSLDVSSVLPAAYSAGLIDDNQRLECGSYSNPYKKTEVFVGIIGREVAANSKNLRTFIQILYNTSHTSIAQRLEGLKIKYLLYTLYEFCLYNVEEYSKNKVNVSSVSPQVAASAVIQSLQVG